MEITAHNGGGCDADTLLEEHPFLYEVLVDLTNDQELRKVELFKEAGGIVFTAKMKTHGYGIVITSDLPEGTGPAFVYALAKPIYDGADPDAKTITLIEGPLTWDIVYALKDNIITLILK